MGRHRLLKEVFRDVQHAVVAGGRSDDEADRKVVRARQSFGHGREHLDAWNSGKLLLHDRQVIFSRNRSFAPWFQDETAEAETRLGDLESETSVLNVLENLAGGVGITNRIVDRRIRGSRDNADDESLV